MNEVFFPRNVFQKLPKSKQDYFFDEMNCALNCGWFHREHGHSTGWRQFFFDLQVERYGRYQVEHYLGHAPLKLERHK